MIKCKTCGEKTVLKVAEHGDLDMFSCCNEECKDYAELLVETNGNVLVSVAEMMDAYRNVVKEIQDEKNKVSEG
jgi:hypothetical protein